MSDRPLRARPGRGANLPSPASLGVVRVGADFEKEFPDAERSSTEAYATLVRTGTALVRELDRSMSETFAVPHAALTALAVIEGAGEPLTPSQISERVLVPSATMTATLDLLERHGWIVRRPNAADRRSLLVEITAEGGAVADRLLPGVRSVEREVMSTLSERERTALLRLLGKVLARTAEMADQPPIPLEGRRRRPRRR